MKLECLTCIIARFTGCSEWDPYEKNARERLDREFPGVFSPQATPAQEMEVEDFLVGRLEKQLFNGNPQLFHDSHYPQFVCYLLCQINHILKGSLKFY